MSVFPHDCAVVNITSQMDSAVIATLTPSGIPWVLPVHFNITITSSNFQTWTINSKTNNNINIAPIQPTMACNISVIPCNSFGCNEGCPQCILPTEGITIAIRCMHHILHVLVYCQCLCDAYPQTNLLQTPILPTVDQE